MHSAWVAVPFIISKVLHTFYINKNREQNKNYLLGHISSVLVRNWIVAIIRSVLTLSNTGDGHRGTRLGLLNKIIIPTEKD